MIRTHDHIGALLLRYDKGAAIGAEGRAVIGGPEEIDARACTEASRQQVYVPVARSREIIHGNPLLVLVGSARRTVHRSHPGHTIVVRPEDLDRRGAETKGGEIDPPRTFVPGQYGVAGIIVNL